MSKIAVMMSENQVKALMSSHFGKAEWIMVVNTDCHTYDFIKSDAAGGKSVVELLSGQNCTDAIFSEIGGGALGHLKSVGIRGWMAPVDISGQQALEMFEHLRLKAAEVATEKSAGHSCCCKQAGAAATSCCGN